MKGVRVAVVAYYYPPIGGGGVRRPLQWVERFAAEGAEVTVVTVDDAAWVHAPRPAIPGVRMLRIPNPDWGRVAAWRDRGINRPSGAAPPPGEPGRLRRWLVPDLHVGWSAAAAWAVGLLAATRAIDLAITTAPPYSIHAAGFAARRFGVPWVADFRDGWTCCPTRSDLPAWRARVERRLEESVWRRADRVWFASEGVRERVMARVGSLAARSETILTGYDAQQFGGSGSAPPERRLVLVHAGSIGLMRRRQGLDALFQALGQMKGANDRVRVRFVGAEPELEAGVPHAAAGSVEMIPRQSPDAIPGLVRAADAALVIGSEGSTGGDPIPGKLFDAAGASRPVLAVTHEGALSALVRRLGLGRVADPEPATIAEALETAWQAKQQGRPAFPWAPSSRAQLAAGPGLDRALAHCDALVGGAG